MPVASALTRQAWARLVLVALACTATVVFAPHHTFLAALVPLDVGTARATAAVLRWWGLEVWREGPVLRHASGFSCEIYYRCTGLLPAGFAAAMIAAWPAPLRLRWKGVVVAVAGLWALNLLRLVSVIGVGIHRPTFFGLAHGVVGEGAMLAAVLGVWLAWLRAVTGHGARSAA
jgi:exosortase/archaeosortase family protein